MSIVVIGVNHRSAPLAVLERLAIAQDDLGKAVGGLVSRDNIREAVVLATCGRTEVYVVAERFHGAYADVTDFLARLGGMPIDDLQPFLLAQHDDAAAAHLFEVAAGLDSAVLGESEILGQVRGAWHVAVQHGGARTALDLLFRHALRAGKRARSETSIARGTTSISQAAVEMATDRLGTLHGRRVLVIGAGDMGAGVASSLGRAGADDIVVANRTPSRGADLADRVGGSVVGFDGLTEALAGADVVVTCAAAPEAFVGIELIGSRPADRPLLVVDIAVPRNVDRSVAGATGVTLLDLDDLRDWADRGRAARAAEANRVREIVGEEIERFLVESTARQAAPLVARLHERAERIRSAEIERFSGRLGDVDRDLVDGLTRSIIAKLLHSPSVRLRHDAGTPQGERNAAAVSDLFELDS
jgi:glutamyl-tRNA reductase